jgi:hypothetical protein
MQTLVRVVVALVIVLLLLVVVLPLWLVSMLIDNDPEYAPENGSDPAGERESDAASAPAARAPAVPVSEGVQPRAQIEAINTL